MTDYVRLLCSLISHPSYSRCEEQTAAILTEFLEKAGLKPRRNFNNVWCINEAYDEGKPTLLLNSHHDTVKPSANYTFEPHTPNIIGGKLYGLGSNDAGASLVSLIEVFRRMHTAPLPFNLMLALTAEEEVTGQNGIRAFLPHIETQGYKIDMAIVGEPTSMRAAIGERGLVVLDCETEGKAGHAARAEGVNAIYRAMEDINAIRNYRFAHESNLLGPISIQITQIEAGWQHNVIPDRCKWVTDIRTTDAYSNEETVAILQSIAHNSRLTPRSTHIRASAIDPSHPLVKSAVEVGAETFVSPTTSDMSQMHSFPSVKMGPGDSARSHSADEYILISEIDTAIKSYTDYITQLAKSI